MTMNYHPGKTNEVEHSLCRLYMVSVAHVEKERKELIRDVHRLARLGVGLVRILNGGVTGHNRSKSH